MKVTKLRVDNEGYETEVVFDNGLVLMSEYTQDCCNYNFLDFEQFVVGREFPDMDGGEFLRAITIKEDGFYIKDSLGVPAWAQARSQQNGYYSAGVDLVIYYNEKRITNPRTPYTYDHMFEGSLVEY